MMTRKAKVASKSSSGSVFGIVLLGAIIGFIVGYTGMLAHLLKMLEVESGIVEGRA